MSARAFRYTDGKSFHDRLSDARDASVANLRFAWVPFGLGPGPALFLFDKTSRPSRV